MLRAVGNKYFVLFLDIVVDIAAWYMQAVSDEYPKVVFK